MREQPELYENNIGFRNFLEFCQPGYEAHQDYSISVDNVMIGFLSCIHCAPLTCEIALITAPIVPVRALLRGLQHLQDGYFYQYGRTLFMTTVNPRLKRLVRHLGWEDRGEHMEITR